MKSEPSSSNHLSMIESTNWSPILQHMSLLEYTSYTNHYILPLPPKAHVYLKRHVVYLQKFPKS
jgi:hypothetical protein